MIMPRTNVIEGNANDKLIKFIINLLPKKLEHLCKARAIGIAKDIDKAVDKKACKRLDLTMYKK